MNVLLTFTGFHDPFPPSPVVKDGRVGPVLTILGERHFDWVHLFSTTRTVDITKTTAEEAARRHPKTKVHIHDLPLKDPTNHRGILRQLRSSFATIRKKHPGAKYFVSVTSGTPHMHACWLLLVASGEIPATLLQTNPPEFVPEGHSPVREIELTHPEFPSITSPILRDEDMEEEEAVTQARVSLGIVGDEPAFLQSLREAAVYAEYDEHVLLLGETGSGKEYFAKFIHHLSPRAHKPMVVVNCGSIPENLVESQLFGHKRGAFTGAILDAHGKFEAANGGILFLDELGELPLAAQAKLLRALESGEIEPVGATHTKTVNVKVIAATNRDLRRMVADQLFREDLFQRFTTSVSIPPLRQRQQDTPKLAVHILAGWNAKHQKQRSLTPAALAHLASRPWPGNIRELRKVVTQSAMLCPGKIIDVKHLRFEEPLQAGSASALPEPGEGFDLEAFLDQTKEILVQRALEKADNVQAQAARLLGITPQALHQYRKRQKA